MPIQHPEKNAELFSALSTYNRLQTFTQLRAGNTPKEISDELGVTRAAIQPYINDFKDLGIIQSEGKSYRVTDKGETVYEILDQIDQIHTELSELQEYLIENPEVVPEEVLEEVRQRREEDQKKPAVRRKTSQLSLLELKQRMLKALEQVPDMDAGELQASDSFDDFVKTVFNEWPVRGRPLTATESGYRLWVLETVLRVQDEEGENTLFAADLRREDPVLEEGTLENL